MFWVINSFSTAKCSQTTTVANCILRCSISGRQKNNHNALARDKTTENFKYQDILG